MSSKNNDTGLVKPVREYERVASVSMKPIQFVPGDTEEDDKCSICFVDSGSKEVIMPCTTAVARRVEGPRTNPKKSGLSGLDSRLDLNFFVLLSDKGGVKTAVGVDTYPKNEPRKFVKPENEDGTVVMSINQASGDVDITSLPQGTPIALIRRILAKVDGSKSINIGDQYPGGYVVESINGNRVTLALQ